jgi:hypothetical protein
MHVELNAIFNARHVLPCCCSMFVGTFVHMLLLVIVVFGFTNWKLEARKAMERVALDSPEIKPPHARLSSTQ